MSSAVLFLFRCLFLCLFRFLFCFLFTFAGAATDATGKWVAKTSETIGGSGSDITITLPAGSAAVVTLD